IHGGQVQQHVGEVAAHGLVRRLQILLSRQGGRLRLALDVEIREEEAGMGHARLAAHPAWLKQSHEKGARERREALLAQEAEPTQFEAALYHARDALVGGVAFLGPELEDTGTDERLRVRELLGRAVFVRGEDLV